MTLRVGLVAGESSGDLLGAGLISAVRQRIPDAVFEGVAGPEMIAAGCERWADAEELAVMGVVEPLRHLPRLLRLRRSLIARWSHKRFGRENRSLSLHQRVKHVIDTYLLKRQDYEYIFANNTSII